MAIPFQIDPTFTAWTASALGASLGGAFLALLAVMRFNIHRLRASVLFQRWSVWAVIAPVYSAAVLLGAPGLFVLMSFLVVQGLREYAAIVGLPRKRKNALIAGGLIAGGLIAAPAAYFSPVFAYGLLAAVGFISVKHMAIGLDRKHECHAILTFFGWAWIAWMLAHLMLIHQHIRGGDGLLLAVGMAVALSDVGAFVVGKTFGRHALAPRLSPNKTIEGVAGNVIGAYAGFGIMYFAIPDQLIGWPIAILPAIVGIGAVGGDLIESAVKRRYTVKDAGDWLPGFGGLLDRIDSLLLVVPVVYYFSTYAVS